MLIPHIKYKCKIVFIIVKKCRHVAFILQSVGINVSILVPWFNIKYALHEASFDERLVPSAGAVLGSGRNFTSWACQEDVDIWEGPRLWEQLILNSILCLSLSISWPPQGEKLYSLLPIPWSSAFPQVHGIPTKDWSLWPHEPQETWSHF